MKKTAIIILSLAMLMVVNISYAQDFKYDVKQSAQVFIKGLSGGVQVEETTGTQLVIEAKNFEKRPARADGLKPIYGNGASDNTNLGLEVKTEDNIIVVSPASKQSEDAKYIFKVPKGVNVKVDYRSPYADYDLVVKNFSSEFEADIMNPGIQLENVTGPIVLNVTNGDVNIVFGTINQSSPIDIVAINGIIDVTVPQNTPANLMMSTINGEVFTNFDIDFEKKDKKGLSYIGGGSKINGKINGGGVDIKLKTINNNIYLRKK